jgi:hypothetical protein
MTASKQAIGNLDGIPGFDPAAPLDKQATVEARRPQDQMILSLRPDLESYVV